MSRPETPVQLRAADEPLNADALFRQLSGTLGGEFQAAMVLLDVLETTAQGMARVDRIRLSRLVTAAGHAIGLTTRGERA